VPSCLGCPRICAFAIDASRAPRVRSLPSLVEAQRAALRVSIGLRQLLRDTKSRRKPIRVDAPSAPGRMAALPIVVAVDVDPDWRIPGASGTPYRGELDWVGLFKGVPQMVQSVRGLIDSQGRHVRFTWLLRSDDQIGSILGDPAFLADRFAEFWRERLAQGDEIGWHPHTWRFSERERVWYQEQKDVDWVRECFRDGHRALSRHFQIRTAKPGWMYHDNFTMRVFDELGIEADLAAMPGAGYAGKVPGTDLPLWVYDWLEAPQEPYYPSRSNYKRPGAACLRLLEVPNWTFPLGLIRSVLHRIRAQSDRDLANPAKFPFLVRRAFTKPPLTVPFVCSFHPEELLGRSLLFACRNVFDNMSALLRVCKQRGIPTRMTVGNEIPPSVRWK